MKRIKQWNMGSQNPKKWKYSLLLLGIVAISGSFHNFEKILDFQWTSFSSSFDDFDTDTDTEDGNSKIGSFEEEEPDSRGNFQKPIERCGDMSENSERYEEVEVANHRKREGSSVFRVESRKLKKSDDGKFLYKVYVCPVRNRNSDSSENGVCVNCRPTLTFSSKAKIYDVSENLSEIKQKIRSELGDDSREESDESFLDDDGRPSSYYSGSFDDSPGSRNESGELARSGGSRGSSRDNGSRDERNSIRDLQAPEGEDVVQDDLDQVIRRCEKQSRNLECKMRGLAGVLKKYKKSKNFEFPESAAIEFYDSQISSDIVERVASRDTDAASLADTLISALNKNYKGLQTRIQSDVMTGLNQAVTQEKTDLRSQLDSKANELTQQAQIYQAAGRVDLALIANTQALRLQQDPFIQRALLGQQINQFTGYFRDLGTQLRDSMTLNPELNKSDGLRFYNDYQTKANASLQTLMQFPLPQSTIGVFGANSSVSGIANNYNQYGSTGTGNSSPGGFMTSPVNSLPGISGNGTGVNSTTGPIPMPAGTPVNGQLVPVGQTLPLSMNAPANIYDPTMNLGTPNGSLPMNSMSGNYPANNGVNFGPRGGNPNAGLERSGSRGR